MADQNGGLAQGREGPDHPLGVEIEGHLADRGGIIAGGGQIDGHRLATARSQGRDQPVPAPGAVPGAVDQQDRGHDRLRGVQTVMA
jgi:hypothetical protein